jgi:hypothetical protein
LYTFLTPKYSQLQLVMYHHLTTDITWSSMVYQSYRQRLYQHFLQPLLLLAQRRRGCPVADEASSSQKVLMQDLACKQNLFGQYNKPLSLIVKFKYAILKIPCLHVKRLQ